MRIDIKESITINKKIDLRTYVLDLESLYGKWAKGHKKFTFTKKTGKGSEFIFEETIGGKKFRIKAKIDSFSPHFVSWSSLSTMPKVGGSLKITGDKLVQEAYVELPLLLFILMKFSGKALTKEQLARHVREELQNFKKIVVHK